MLVFLDRSTNDEHCNNDNNIYTRITIFVNDLRWNYTCAATTAADGSEKTTLNVVYFNCIRHACDIYVVTNRCLTEKLYVIFK